MSQQKKILPTHPMKKITFTKQFGQEEKKVELSNLSDVQNVFFLNVGGYHRGLLNKYNGQWIGCFNNKSEFTADDVQFLGNFIDNNFVSDLQVGAA